MSEYLKLKHSYRGTYREPTFTEKHTNFFFSLHFLGLILAIIAIQAFIALVVWTLYGIVAPYFDLPRIPYLLVFGVMFILKLIFGGCSKR